MDLRTVRLAIAAWEKGASWRDRGWAGENNRAAAGSCTPRKSQLAPPSTLDVMTGNKQAWRDHLE